LTGLGHRRTGLLPTLLGATQTHRENSDETGWRNNGEKRYLWALVARTFVFYWVAKTRSSEVLMHLMGTVFAGILCSDRFSAYFKYHGGMGQLCWAHLKRNILGIQDFTKTTDAQRFCRDALALYARLFPSLAQISKQLDRSRSVDPPLDSAGETERKSRR